MLLGWLVLALPTEAAICHNGCSGHGSCGLLGSCICEGNWAGRDCSFQLSLDAELPAQTGDLREETLDTTALLDESLHVSPPKRSALAFAQSRRAAESAWATADKLFAAARSESTQDAIERVERAVSMARSRKDEIPGSAFAGMQAPPAANLHPCRSDCSNQGMCLAGKCLCNNGFYGESCEHRRCLNDCSGNGQCLTGRCKCSVNYGGEDCSQLLQTQSSLAAFLKRGLAAESEELAKQQSTFTVKQKKEKACPLNCNSRGDCRDGTCQCRDGWTGLSCQDYEQPALVDFAEASTACAGQCSGNGICELGQCRCNEGFHGKACELRAAEPTVKPLQLQLQQVTKEDEERALTCMGGCGGHGECKVGICDCEAGWQGTSCNISAEAALQGIVDEEQDQLAKVPSAGSWIATSAASGRALRAPQLRTQDSKPSLLSTNIQGQTQPHERESSLGTSAATALNAWLKTARKVSKGRPVDELASLLSAAIAPPQD